MRMASENSVERIKKRYRDQRPQIDRRCSNHQGENKGENPTQEESDQKAPSNGAVNPRGEEHCWTRQGRAGPSDVGIRPSRGRFVFRRCNGHVRLGTPERVWQVALAEIITLVVGAVV